MAEISREQKLELVRQIKTQYHQNQYDLYNREHLLYATTSDIPQQNTKNNTSDSLKFRSVVTILIFIIIVLFDSFGIGPEGMEIKQLFEFLQTDYMESFSGWQAPL